MSALFDALTKPFVPPWWLSGVHAQSMLASTLPRRWRLERRAQPWLAHARSEVLNLPDGVRLLCEWDEPQGRPVTPDKARVPQVVLLHGWEGSARSVHMLSAATVLLNAGIPTVRLNFRDHGGTHHLNPELFHSCRLEEVVNAIRLIRERVAERPLILVGFSLGGNFALRVATTPGVPIDAVVAICPPLNPAHSLIQLQNRTRIYRHYFLKKWNRSLTLKRQSWPQLYDEANCPNGDDLLAMTDLLVRRFTDFPSVERYFEGYAIVGDRLNPLTTAAAIVLAADDPIIPVEDRVHLADTARLRVIEQRYGGHCGFLPNLQGPSWIDHRLVEVIESLLHST